MSETGNGGLRQERYLPGEVCVVVESEAAGADAARLYEGVRRWLNQRIAASLAQSPWAAAADAGSFERDLTPATLREAFRGAGAGDVLQPLNGRSTSPAQNARRAWVFLPRRGAPSLAQFLYRVGPNAGDAETGTAYVRDVVNLVNRRLLRGPDEIDATQSWYVVAATPHWLAAGSQSEATDGGPASRPAPAPAGDWRFKFSSRRLTALVDEASEESIVVAVLDTCPDREQVRQAARRYRGNELLRWADRSVRFNGEASIVPPELAHLEHTVVNWGQRLARAQAGDDAYRMADHGLFTSGIIRQLAPKAEIHLIRTLNDYGVGDLFGLVDVLRQLPDRLLARRRQRKHLVVNLSLVADVPPAPDLLDFWLPDTARDHATLRRRHADVSRTLDHVHRSLAEAVGWLTDQGVLVVAAAGNDAHGNRGRPEPRVPARYDEVLSVAAVHRGPDGRPSDEPAIYSNRGDVAVMGNGLAVFGGNARFTRDGPPEVVTRRSPVDAVVGIFSAPQLPLGGGQNDTGWAYWSGTSFATPIAAAVAANVWAENPGYRPRQVIEGVRRFAVHEADPLDRDGPLDCPTLLVDQVRS